MARTQIFNQINDKQPFNKDDPPMFRVSAIAFYENFIESPTPHNFFSFSATCCTMPYLFVLESPRTSVA
jgi:hypothetical protein